VARKLGLLAEHSLRFRREPKGGCAGRLRRTVLYQGNSLILGKIQGISPKSGKSRTLGASTHKALLVEFPTRWNREYTDANSEFSLR